MDISTINHIKLAKLFKLHQRLNRNSVKYDRRVHLQQISCYNRYCRHLKITGLTGVLSLIGITDINFLSAQCPAAGLEFQVNTFTTNHQHEPAIAMDGDGNFVIAWQSGRNRAGSGEEQDGSLYGIFAQRFNAVGVPVGPEFLVNTYTTDWQVYPALAMDYNGNFVIAWTDYEQDNSTTGIYARRYNAAGVALDALEFRVNSYTTFTQSHPAVAMDHNGDFVVAWRSIDQDNGTIGVYAQRYDSSGNPEGLEFRANSYTTSNQTYPDVAMDKDGNFVIAWTSYGQDGESGGIYARLYKADGTDQGPEFVVNSFTTGNQSEVAVDMNKSGNFVVTWRSYEQDGSEFGVYAQRFNALGMKLGSEFGVNTFTASDQEFSDVAVDDYGGFVIVWEDKTQDGNIHGVYAQQYDQFGMALGSNFLVNTETFSSQGLPVIATDGHHGFVIAWRSFAQDGNLNGIYAQRFSCPDPIPALSQWGLVLLGFVFIILGVVGWKQKLAQQAEISNN